MSSRSFRGEFVPSGIILWYNESGCLPVGYAHECTLYGKFLKGTAACVNPGSCAGSNTHSDPCHNFSHTHSQLTNHNHSHTTSWGPNPVITGQAPFSGSMPQHTHTAPNSTSTSANICSSAHSSNHNHNSGAACNQPTHVVIRNIKKNSTLYSFRKTGLPKCVIITHHKPLTCKPQGYTITLTGNRFFKGVAAACTVPGTLAGSTCHSHPTCAGAHTHSFTVASHTHSSSGTSGSGGVSCASHSPACAGIANPGAHTHSGTICLTSTIQNGTSISSGGHTHGVANHLPPYYDLAYYKKTSISIRAKHIPPNTIMGWLGTLASIPSKYALANGSNGTPNLLSKYIRSVLNACTNPGSTGGCANHNHPSAGGHQHISTGTHTHSTTGTSSGHANGVNPRVGGPAGGSSTSTACGHPAATPSGTSVETYTLDTQGAHQHGTTSNDPAHKTIAWVMRL